MRPKEVKGDASLDSATTIRHIRFQNLISELLITHCMQIFSRSSVKLGHVNNNDSNPRPTRTTTGSGSCSVDIETSKPSTPFQHRRALPRALSDSSVLAAAFRGGSRDTKPTTTGSPTRLAPASPCGAV